MQFEKRNLVNDGRAVAAIAIGGGMGISGKALDLAWERGIAYFFYAPVFPTYRSEAKWLKEKFKSSRDKIAVGTCTYFWKAPGSLERSLRRHLKWLGTDYLDYFHLGMVRKDDPAAVEQLLRFKEKKLIRHLAFSSHDRQLAAQLVKKYPFDLAMIRYNAAHRGAETEFFPSVDPVRISVVAFNTTRHKSLLKAPKGWDKNKPVPTAGDCYRFALTHPKVTMVLAGPSNEKHMREILATLDQGPMTEAELKWMREFGDAVYGRKSAE